MAGLAMVTVVGQDRNTIFNNIVLRLLCPVSLTTANLETSRNLQSRGFPTNQTHLARPRILSHVIVRCLVAFNSSIAIALSMLQE